MYIYSFNNTYSFNKYLLIQYSFSKYLSSTYYQPSTAFGSWNTSGKKTMTELCRQSPCRLPGTSPLIRSSQHTYVAGILIPILQMKKVRLNESNGQCRHSVVEMIVQPRPL